VNIAIILFQKLILKTTIMRLTNININSKMTGETFSVKKLVRVQFKSRCAEIIAWAVFFGIGVAYFAATLFVAF